jgi:hypothetical protein
MVDKIKADEIVLIAKKQLDVSSNFKQPRMLEIIDIIEKIQIEKKLAKKNGGK